MKRKEEEEEEKRREDEEKRRRKKQKGIEWNGILKFCMDFHEIVWLVACPQT